MVEKKLRKHSDTSNSKKAGATKSRLSRREFLSGMAGGRWQLGSPRTILRSLSGEAQAVGLGHIDMLVADSCTLCNACVESCPQRAITINQGKLDFMPGECNGCGDCARICPENSITLSKVTAPVTLSTSTIYRDEMIRCTKCKAPYASAKMLKKIEATLRSDEAPIRLCPNCRQNQIYQSVFGKTVMTSN